GVHSLVAYAEVRFLAANRAVLIALFEQAVRDRAGAASLRSAPLRDRVHFVRDRTVTGLVAVAGEHRTIPLRTHAVIHRLFPAVQFSCPVADDSGTCGLPVLC